MRLAPVIFSTLLYLLPCVVLADTPAKKVDPADKILVRLGEMKPAEQQAWLQRLENRVIRAAKISMNADNAALQKKKVQGMLHQKMVTWQILREVMADVNTQETAAIDHLVRRYRGLIFDKFGKDPDALDQHREAWEKAYSDWKLAGQPFEEHDRLIDWLERAIEGIPSGTMPEEPKFEKQPVAKEEPQAKAGASVKEKPQTQEETPAAEKSQAEKKTEEKKAATEKPPAEEKLEAAEKPQAEQPVKAAEEGKKAETAEKPEPKQIEAKPEEKPAAAEKVPAEERLQKEESKQEEDKPATEPKLEKPAKSDSDMSKSMTPKTVQPPLPVPEAAARLQKHDSGKEVVPGAKIDKGSSQVESSPAGKRPPAALARRQALPMPTLPEDRKPLPARKAQAIGVTAPKVAADAVQQTAALDLPSETRVAAPTLAPTLPEEATEAAGDQASAGAVEIKVEELVSRIEGCNLALRAIESELDENDHWTIERLETITDRLKILTLRHGDLAMFREAVPEDTRKSLEKLDSPKGAISQMATRIVETRRAVFSDKFKGTDAERENTVQRLDELSRRLAAMAEK